MIRPIHLIIAILSIIGHLIHTKGTPISISTTYSSTTTLLPKESSCDEAQEIGISLNFRKVGLRHLDSGFASSPSVRCLNLEENEIEYVAADALQPLPNLIHLNLAHNHLSFANISQLEGHEHLRTLILDGNQVPPADEEKATLEFVNIFPSLWYLSLRSSGLHDISSLAFAPQLRHLLLSSNDLSTSDLSFFNEPPKSLILLDLTNASLHTFDASSLISVQELHLDDNRFQRICGKSCRDQALVLENMQVLRYLSLARNELLGLEPDALDDADSLEELDLSQNLIDAVRKGSFEGATALRHLNLSKNLLSEMPDLCGPEALRYLLLADNRIESIEDDAFCLIASLRVIDLSGNRIKSVDANAFANQIELEILDLSNNKIASFPAMWLTPLSGLRVLRVNDNRLSRLTDLALENVKVDSKLEHVYLQNNFISVFHTNPLFNVFRVIPNVTIEFMYAISNDTFDNFKNIGSDDDDDEECKNKCECDEDNEV